ncbi:MAG: tetratricopeptide repeat protein [Nitrospinae bacterium]|nr:tetratricopeptide repeat protein [Nitrospinota bacterium]
MKRFVAGLLAAACMGFGYMGHLAMGRGNSLYAEGKFREALEEYQKAQGDDPKMKEADYNIGNALFRLGKLAEASASYEKALDSEDPQLRKNAQFNRCVALYSQAARTHEQGKNDEARKFINYALSQCRESLKTDPADDGARTNYETALALSKIIPESQPKSGNMEDKSGSSGDKNRDEKGDEKKTQAGNQGGAPQGKPTPAPQAEDKRQNEDKGKPQQSQSEKGDGEQADNAQQGGQGEGGISSEQAGRVFSAIAQDEKNLRDNIRKKAQVKEQKRTGKDW